MWSKNVSRKTQSQFDCVEQHLFIQENLVRLHVSVELQSHILSANPKAHTCSVLLLDWSASLTSNFFRWRVNHKYQQILATMWSAVSFCMCSTFLPLYLRGQLVMPVIIFTIYAFYIFSTYPKWHKPFKEMYPYIRFSGTQIM